MTDAPEEFVAVAGLWRRLVARLIDTGIMVGTIGLVILAGVPNDHWALAVFGLTGVFMYDVGMLLVWGATVGKLLLRLRVYTWDAGEQLTAGRALGRTVAYYAVSALPCSIGQVIVLVSANNDSSGWQRSWHDRVAGTVVVRVSGATGRVTTGAVDPYGRTPR